MVIWSKVLCEYIHINSINDIKVNQNRTLLLITTIAMYENE